MIFNERERLDQLRSYLNDYSIDYRIAIRSGTVTNRVENESNDNSRLKVIDKLSDIVDNLNEGNPPLYKVMF